MISGEMTLPATHDEQFAEAGIENQFGRDTRVAAAENRGARVLALCKVRQDFLLDRREARLAPYEPFVAGCQPCERFVSRVSGFGNLRHLIGFRER